MARHLCAALGITILIIGVVSASFARDYIVGEEDILKITVYGHPELLTTSRVSGNGMITFPLIGSVEVGGLTVSQISRKIASLLADGYIIDPNVSVFIEEFRSKRATIMGQVSKPGIYTLSGPITFLELLSKAGGLSKDAGDTATLKRSSSNAGNNETIITIDLKKLIEMGDTSGDIPLMDGDSVYIKKAGVFYVTGEVKKPDAYKYEEKTTVIKAVTMAGGFTDKAATGKVRIMRKVNGKEEVLERMKMDDPVLPEDVIVVPESFF